MNGDDICETCDGTGSVCLCCDRPIEDCECFDESEPSLCLKCMGSGRATADDEIER